MIQKHKSSWCRYLVLRCLSAGDFTEAILLDDLSQKPMNALHTQPRQSLRVQLTLGLRTHTHSVITHIFPPGGINTHTFSALIRRKNLRNCIFYILVYFYIIPSFKGNRRHFFCTDCEGKSASFIFYLFFFYNYLTILSAIPSSRWNRQTFYALWEKKYQQNSIFYIYFTLYSYFIHSSFFQIESTHFSCTGRGENMQNSIFYILFILRIFTFILLLHNYFIHSSFFQMESKYFNKVIRHTFFCTDYAKKNLQRSIFYILLILYIIFFASFTII